MTRTARSKLWRRARVQIQFLQAELSAEEEEAIVFLASFPVPGWTANRERGTIFIRSGRIRFCCAVRIDRVCHWEFHFWKSLDSGSRHGLRSNEPRISAGCFQLAVLSPTGEPLCGSRTGESLDGVVGFQLGGPSIRGERRVPASPTVDSQTSKMKGGELSLEQVRVLPPRAAPRPHPWIRRFDKFAPLGGQI